MENMEVKYLQALDYYKEHFSDGSRLADDPYMKKHAAELIVCFEKAKDIVDFDFWTQYEELVNEKMSYEEYVKLDSKYDGDPLEVEIEKPSGEKELIKLHFEQIKRERNIDSLDERLSKISKKVENRNYQLLESIVKPLLDGKVDYIKFTSDVYMDLNIERLGHNRIAMAHNYIQYGDVMADPDMEIIIDNDKKAAYAQTYQQDNLGVYQSVSHQPEIANSLNSFLNDWLKNIKGMDYHVQRLYADGLVYDAENDEPSKLESFMKDNGITHLLNTSIKTNDLVR